jgi:hypothetical protein
MAKRIQAGGQSMTAAWYGTSPREENRAVRKKVEDRKGSRATSHQLEGVDRIQAGWHACGQFVA